MLDLKDYIASIPDFPVKGILFRDVTPILEDPKAFDYACELLAEFGRKVGANVVAGPESRGFIFGCPTALKIGAGFVPVRKPGKLPRKVITEDYSLEYGVNTLCMHEDSIKKGDKVLIIDDLLATGGTLKATAKLVERLGGEVVGIASIIELVDLKGRELIKDYNYYTVLQYEGE